MLSHHDVQSAKAWNVIKINAGNDSKTDWSFLSADEKLSFDAETWHVEVALHNFSQSDASLIHNKCGVFFHKSTHVCRERGAR